MQLEDDLFALSPHLQARFEMLGGVVPVILVDNVYARPDDIREMALGLSYTAPDFPYPGKLAVPPPSQSLLSLTQWALRKANEDYLPHVPPMSRNGQRIERFGQIYTDFAIVDVHPDELSPQQRLPHTDPVPVFGLVYLNREKRGGTLFFEQIASVKGDPAVRGYITDSTGEFRLRGRIEAEFNRLAIYPGFILHSGEIGGSWIEDERRYSSPRLTQRLVFIP